MIDQLDYSTYSKYHRAIRHLRAREMMDDLTISTHPWKKKAGQETALNRLQRDFYIEKTPDQMSTAEVFSALRANQ